MRITSYPNFNKNVLQKKIKKLSKKEKEKLIKSTKKIFDKIDKLAKIMSIVWLQLARLIKEYPDMDMNWIKEKDIFILHLLMITLNVYLWAKIITNPNQNQFMFID